MTDTWRLYLSPPAVGAWNMAVDESILEHVGRGDSSPTLRLYGWKPACLSLGRSQPISDANREKIKEEGWHLVRRITGGRAILHTNEITYAVIAPEGNPHVRGSVLESYRHLAQALLVALENLGAKAEMHAEKASLEEQKNALCFENPSAYEITVGGKKIIGSAQARQRGGVLQHGSLPLTGDLGRVTEALTYPNAEARQRAAEMLGSRASTLESALGRAVAWDTASKSFVRAFEAVLDIQLKREELSLSELVRVADLVKEKYAHPDWTERI